MKLIQELTQLTEAKAAPQKITTKIIKEFGDGVYIIPTAAIKFKFDKTDFIMGQDVAQAIKDYNESIDRQEFEDLADIIPSKLENFLRQHPRLIEISAYDGSSGSESDTLLMVGEPSDVKVIVKGTQDPGNWDEYDFEDAAKELAQKTKFDPKKLKAWVNKWEYPNKIYSLVNGAETLIMIAEND